MSCVGPHHSGATCVHYHLPSPFSLSSIPTPVLGGCQISLYVLMSAHTIVYPTQYCTLIIKITREKYWMEFTKLKFRENTMRNLFYKKQDQISTNILKLEKGSPSAKRYSIYTHLGMWELRGDWAFCQCPLWTLKSWSCMCRGFWGT